MESFLSLSSSREGTEHPGGGQDLLNEWQKRLNEAEKIINKSVEEFAKNLWQKFTWELLKTFKDFQAERDEKKTTRFNWLSELGLWQQALIQVYQKNWQEMPPQISNILSNLCNLLKTYEEKVWKLKSLSEMLQAYISIAQVSESADKISSEEFQRSTFWISPSATHHRWRDV